MGKLSRLDQQDVSVEDRVTQVVQRFLVVRSVVRSLSPTEDLREAGLSSLDMINLVLSIEAKFDITIPESDVAPANFRSIGAIGTLIRALLGRA